MGDAVLENRSNSVLFVGHPLINLLARADYSVIERLGVAKGESNLVTRDTFDELEKLVNVENMSPGCSSSNSAIAYSYLGGKTSYYGLMGDDDEATAFGDMLATYGVDNIAIRVPGQRTSQVYCLVTPDADRTMYVLFGASHTMKPSDLDENIMERFDYYAVNGFMFADEDQVALTNKMVESALSRGKGVITLFANSFCIRRNGKYLKPIADVSAYISGNLEEYTELYEIYSREELFSMFEERTSGSTPQHKAVVITMGSEGAMVMCQGTRVYVPPCNVEVVDTTGAGDFFAGSFLYGVLNGWNVRKAGQFAVAMVSDIISHMGLTISKDTRAVIDAIKNADPDEIDCKNCRLIRL
ncbi:Ribokinase-like superfamily protein, putative [Babesia bigemina]|uniref:Ribokinase-like superfamily protein, putative n=1 Tax=Babesia bigemina TaxID=5866 RepID=A0A061CYJ6_BABBI|nr:Ribokinase-like superfamily protein, putative [Babesia bigemina]CDR93716.1 Ribokinase-like superfamily protein, putative [Babesia bigemina]|eukprot:XP_012765902.1 Ribokinase-like superfamily protein, putative [Babesia bigemina]